MSSSGYTPVFQSIYTGTLYGRWPAAAVWASLLPLFDKNGHLDMSYQAIAGMTGWPVELLQQGIAQLMEPDAHSRTEAEEGRRMVPLEQGRDWGWRAVNHGKYREKARLASKNAREAEEGKNAARMADRRRPPETAGDRRRPPLTAPQTQTQTQTKKEEMSSSPATQDDLAGSLFEFWKQTHGHPKAKLDAKRRRVIAAALKLYDAETLRQSISGYLLSPFHMGENEHKRKYDDIELMLRDARHIDDGLAFSKPGAFQKLAGVERRYDY